ncbi:flagellin N-terminal helical domain-containing protein [Aestuariispira ectoiniformans]|uniref:flagellin N-terminal helical domain-containing protein n=1 Tax=Aestuariispira ectoiniformans TaxID=2775080 RepID=UPI00223AF89F|nr:flagellin [Aestuariispira ectoiniformans]
MADVSKTSAVNSSLQSIQKITKAAGKAQTALTTGRKVNKVTDDPNSYFVAKALSDRAGDLTQRKAAVDQGVSALNVANTALDSIDKFAEQLKGIAEAAKSASPAEQRALSRQFEEVGRQISNVAQDASYQGVNLLTGNNQLDVQFDQRPDSRLTVDGLNLDGTAVNAQSGLFSVAAFQANGDFKLSAFGLAGGSFTAAGGNVGQIGNVIGAIDSGISRLRGQAASLGSNVAILRERLNYTDQQANELQTGADKLTLADLNEEAARTAAAQTRHQIGINSLSIAGDQQRAILQLLGNG